MTQERATPNSGDVRSPYQKGLAGSYYALLGLHPSASVRDIRQAYRDLSKLYHPDTTTLPATIATTKFQQLNEAYATLSSPEQRRAYDRRIGYSSVPVIQPLPSLNQTNASTPQPSSSAYLDATDRPLSPGEIFALFILGITFLACLVLAVMIGLTRGETVLQSQAQPDSVGTGLQQQVVIRTAEPISEANPNLTLRSQAIAPATSPAEATSPDAETINPPSHSPITPLNLPSLSNES